MWWQSLATNSACITKGQERMIKSWEGVDRHTNEVKGEMWQVGIQHISEKRGRGLLRRMKEWDEARIWQKRGENVDIGDAAMVWWCSGTGKVIYVGLAEPHLILSWAETWLLVYQPHKTELKVTKIKYELVNNTPCKRLSSKHEGQAIGTDWKQKMCSTTNAYRNSLGKDFLYHFKAFCDVFGWPHQGVCSTVVTDKVLFLHTLLA